jgi:hypothetical protein
MSRRRGRTRRSSLPQRAALADPVGQRRRGGLVHDAHDLEPRDAAGVPRRLPLGVVEVRRHGDDGLAHGSAERLLRASRSASRIIALISSAECTRSPTFTRAVCCSPSTTVVRQVLRVVGEIGRAASHEALDAVDRLGRETRRRGLAQRIPRPASRLRAAGRRTAESHRPVRARQDARAGLIAEGDEGVGGSKIDSDDQFVVLAGGVGHASHSLAGIFGEAGEIGCGKWAGSDSNRRRTDYESVALDR